MAVDRVKIAGYEMQIRHDTTPDRLARLASWIDKLVREKKEKFGNISVARCALLVALRSDMRFDTSIHVAFETDEILSRIIERHDGQPLWDSALTLEDGSTTVSPFVVLEAR